MKPCWGLRSACALCLLVCTAAPVHAAWDNVFQVCCNSCGGSQPAVSHYAAADPCNPCPQPVCTTRYVQRCYYQPVTSYVTKSYYEPVTTYRTSYYYEPVVSYRYSCYYDPCTCSYQQVACPTTSYRLRSQCCAVQSWAQRCCQVPVTSYRIASYWEPVTSCCTPTPQCCPTAMSSAPAPTTSQPPLASPPAPSVTEQRSAGQANGMQAPAASGASPTPLYDQYNRPPTSAPNQMPNVPGGTSRVIQPQAPATLPAGTPRPQPRVRLDRVVSLAQAQLQGQVFRPNASPRGGTQLLFVSANSAKDERKATADADGKFHVALSPGAWKVYVRDASGQPVYHSDIDIKDQEIRQVTLLSR